MSHRSSIFRLTFIASLTLAIGLVSAASASAATTIGQQPPAAPATSGCAGASSDFVQPTVTKGGAYVVPAGSNQFITSFSTFAGPGTGQIMTAKIFRLVPGTTATFKVVGHDGPLNLNPNVVNTFKTKIAVQPGDVLGLSHASGSSISCSFPLTGQTGQLWSTFTDLQDGQQGNFTTIGNDSTLNLSATVDTPPSNDFDLTKVKKNKNKGTAVVTVNVPGPGTLTLGGTGIKAQRSTGGATISKDVEKAGPVTLKVKAKGHKKTKLADRGKVKVKASITFTPSGDLGVAKTDTQPIKLIDN
jgi:hypothetical protein